MDNLRPDSDVFLIPASSVEAEKLINRTLTGDGLDEQTIETEFEDDLEALGDETAIEQLRTELEELRSTAATGEDSGGDRTGSGVQCWPLDERIATQYTFSPGDLLLFYTGDKTYRFAATVSGTAMLNQMGSLVVSEPTNDRSRSLFVTLADVVPVQVKSSVIAEIADRELDTVQNVSPLDTAARDRLRDSYGDLPRFVRRAQAGINTTPGETNSAALDGLIQDTPERDNPAATDADSSDTPNDDAVSDDLSGDAAEWIEAERSYGVDSADTETDSNASAGASGTESVGSSSAASTGPDPQQSDTDTRTSDDIPTAETEQVLEWSAQPDWKALRDTLNRTKLVVLAGPRGTGKRQLVDALADEWLTDRGRVRPSERVLHTQFHTDIQYSEFVLGQFGDGNHSGLVAGPFGQFVDLAAADSTQYPSSGSGSPPKYLLIIEGFQNASPTRVFGEFWQAIHPANRGPDHPVRISASTAKLWVPENLYIVGIADTNSAPPQDQLNIADSPFAIRRTKPDYKKLRAQYGYGADEVADSARNGDFIASSILALEELNRRIHASEALDDRQVLGHLFLSRSDESFTPYNESKLHQAWQYDVFSTLSGYHEDGLTGLSGSLFDGIDLDAVPHFTLGHLHSDAAGVREVIKSLAVSHSEY